jgi:hypothetical protein
MASQKLHAIIAKCLEKIAKMEDVKEIIRFLQAMAKCLELMEKGEIPGEKSTIACLTTLYNAM